MSQAADEWFSGVTAVRSHGRDSALVFLCATLIKLTPLLSYLDFNVTGWCKTLTNEIANYFLSPVGLMQ